MSVVFGPVPSRRLGKSLGINNIPPKECTFACVYCQLGNTLKLEIERKVFYSTEKIVGECEKHIKLLNRSNNKIDFLTFVPDGEPTLDLNLGTSISALHKLGIKIAVITNSSLTGNAEVREDLSKADWVSLKIDTVNENTWHKINRPHGRVNFSSVLEGVKIFSNVFNNFLATETMLVRGFNDNDDELNAAADFIATLNPNKAYISIPTRPPAENGCVPPDIEVIHKAYQIFKSKGIDAELIIGYEGNEFSSTGNFVEDILNITAVHPMRNDAVESLLEKDGGMSSDLDSLVNSGELIKLNYNQEVFYLRNLKKWRKREQANPNQ
ncbi:cyclic pyranopterin monophosphate synthase [bacterium BMS3Abin04]|nr:cyclic pyranopterin monophosphate synthase [bacterium BMS3Abin04]